MSNAWTLRIDDITGGMVATVNLTATRKCGRIEKLTAFRFPAGWRMNASNVPKSVGREAMDMVRREAWWV